MPEGMSKKYGQLTGLRTVKSGKMPPENTDLSAMPEQEEVLKPCPFCGGESVGISYGRKNNDMPFPYAECSDCTAMISGSEDNEASVIKAWNSRSETGEAVDEERIMERAIEYCGLVGINRAWASHLSKFYIAQHRYFFPTQQGGIK